MLRKYFDVTIFYVICYHVYCYVHLNLKGKTFFSMKFTIDADSLKQAAFDLIVKLQ